ncbi:MAG: hypothetical protein IRZ03_18895, partial [Acidobacterium ailaaui]|nr:hypothetical protein [Pseudacidobacterium ailaaui]
MPATMNNDQARAAFLGAAVDRSQTLPRVAWSSQNNQPIIFNLPKAGYAKYALIDFQGTLTISGNGGSISLSPKGPWNLIDNVNLQDYLGITRINTSGYSLYQWLIKRLAFGFDPANPVVTEAYSAMRYAASIGGANGAAGTYPWAMSWIVPIAADPFGFDTRGTYPFTVADG